MLVEYRFRPGEQLMIGELADHLRVSSTPVREVLIRLQTEGLLRTAPRRGFFAKTLDLKEMIDLSYFRFHIVQCAIGCALDTVERTGTVTALSLAPEPSEPHHLAAAIDTADGDRSRDAADYVEGVWENIAALSDNAVATAALRNAHDRTRYVRIIDLEATGRLNHFRRLIGGVSVALQQKNSRRAIAILRADLDDQIERMPELVKDGINRGYASSHCTFTPPSADGVLPALSRNVRIGARPTAASPPRSTSLALGNAR